MLVLAGDWPEVRDLEHPGNESSSQLAVFHPGIIAAACDTDPAALMMPCSFSQDSFQLPPVFPFPGISKRRGIVGINALTRPSWRWGCFQMLFPAFRPGSVHKVPGSLGKGWPEGGWSVTRVSSPRPSSLEFIRRDRMDLSEQNLHQAFKKKKKLKQ